MFEFLSRFEESDELLIVDRAEARVLWNILAFLQEKLVSPLENDYLKQLQQARDSLRND